jgi:hypothetical protein
MAFDVKGFQQPDYQFNPVAGNKYAPQDGMTQLNNLLDYQEKQALLQPKIEAGKAESKKKVLESEKAGVDLQQHYANIARGTYGGLLTDPDFINGNKEAIKKKLDQTKEYLHSIGVPEVNGGKAHNDLVSLVDEDPKQAIQMIRNGVQQAGSNTEQFTQANRAPTPVSTGQGTQFVPTSQYQGAQQNQFVQGQIPIGTKQVAQPGDASGLPPGTEYLVGPQGQVQPVQPGYGQPNGVTPSQMNRPANQQTPVVSALSPQTSTNLELGNNLVNNSREQAGKAVQIESAANQAIQLSQVTDTGQGAQLWNALKGNYVGIPEFNPKNPAANFDILGHVLTNETNLLSQNPAYGAGKMGGTGGTQKQIEQAVQTAGKTTWNPEAIQYTSRYNRALAYGVQMFNHGVDKSQTISNNNPIYANQYQQQWNSNLNLDSIRLADAKRNAGIDKEGLIQITKELGGEKSERYRKAQEDLRAINNLATRGK